MNYIKQHIANLFDTAKNLYGDKDASRVKFPEFKSINYEDKYFIKKVTDCFLPYSDFNFTSAYTWNVHNYHAYSLDGKNLILRLADYVTGNPVYTVLGTHNIEATLEKLILLCKADTTATIKLVPDITIDSIAGSTNFTVSEDTDNKDYIFSLQELSVLQGGRFKNKRHAANKCERETAIHFKQLHNISNREIHEVQQLVHEWEGEKALKGKFDNESETELQALLRVFKHFNDQEELVLSLAYNDETLVGFSVDECLSNEYVISHYFKALPSIPGLSEHFNRYVATTLHNKGFKYWNWEQDLGIEELRQMKRGYRPTAMLRKFKIFSNYN